MCSMPPEWSFFFLLLLLAGHAWFDVVLLHSPLLCWHLAFGSLLMSYSNIDSHRLLGRLAWPALTVVMQSTLACVALIGFLFTCFNVFPEPQVQRHVHSGGSVSSLCFLRIILVASILSEGSRLVTVGFSWRLCM